MQPPVYYQTTVPVARGLMAMLSPLTGTRATGKLLLTATAGNSAVVPASAYCYPIVNGQACPDLLFKAQINPLTAQSGVAGGPWNVPETGLTVDFMSNLGGARYNLPVATKFVFDPPIENLDTVGAPPLCNVAFTGGAPLGLTGALQDIVFYEQLTGDVLSKDLARSGVKGLPAAIITWEDTQLIDGVTTPVTMRASRAGDSASMYKLSMNITVISHRAESNAMRRTEGLSAMDVVAALLLDRNMADDVEVVSAPSSIQLRRMVREEGSQEYYQRFWIYHVQIACTLSIKSIERRSFADWLLAVVDTYVPQEVPLANQGDFHLVSDMEIPMSGTPPHPVQRVPPTTRYLTTFTDADLVLTGPNPGGSAKLYLNHNLNVAVVDVVIRDNTGVVVNVDQSLRVDDNNEAVDLGSLRNAGPIPGTWTALVLSGHP